MSKRLIHCSTAVNKKAVRREVVDGVEHIIVSSYTLPDDIVMNGILYPAEEIEAGYKSLERTLAPLGHPKNSNGQYISANDPIAIHNYHAGAFNVNVVRKDGRVHVEKHINVQEAMKSDRGKLLLDRVRELEINEDPRPVHTSVGVFIDVEKTDGIKTNSSGQEYSMIARGMIFDHDAILLDTVGAAKPNQGVGMAVNAEGDSIDVEECLIEVDPPQINNNESLTMSDHYQAVREALQESGLRADWIEELYLDKVVYGSDDKLYTVPYTIDESTGKVKIVGIPITVERKVTYNPKVNTKGDAMKEMILNALAAAGIATEGLDDTALLEAYGKLQANQSDDDSSGAASDDKLAEVVANALRPVTDKLASLESKLTANENTERDRMAELVANSGKYPGIDVETAKMLPVEKLKSLAANCNASHGLPLAVNIDGGNAGKFATEMPE